MPRFTLAAVLSGGCFCAAILTSAPSAQTSRDARVVFLSFEEARPALELLAHLRPAELKSLDPASPRSNWADWTRRSDADIRSRLRQGDDDSLVNMLLFGTSFTGQPRLTARQLESENDKVIALRLSDLIAAAAQPGAGERLAFARRVFEAKGYLLDTAEGRSKARAYMLAALTRALQDIGRYDQVIRQIELLKDTSAQFAERSKIYRTRGLSSDNSLRPGFALEQALKGVRAGGFLTEKALRVAVVGPGLDFADKLEGYDFYPPQSIQPFALVDSLLRLGLAVQGKLAVATFDLSPRVNSHLADLRARSLRGQPYVVQLPLDASEDWDPEFLRYWSAFGDRLGTPVQPLAAPVNAGKPQVRAVRIDPAIGATLSPLDLNIIVQRLDLSADERFDLIVATNVFVYYDEFQQALAMANIERMLRPGGILLSNNALVELPGSRLQSVGHSAVTYSTRSGDADVIVWYQAR